MTAFVTLAEIAHFTHLMLSQAAYYTELEELAEAKQKMPEDQAKVSTLCVWWL